jgi:hypothetical protein
MDRMLTLEDFADKLGHRFAIAGADDASGAMAGAVVATLAEAEPLHTGRAVKSGRAPFSLVFVAEQAESMPQRLYRIEHETLGIVSVFLVPIGRDARGVAYQATFN